ncbi:hypothetical protein ACI3KS_12800 [Microbacterium sp. ZW T5_45]|uniref:hypothetical protein n=1 Tax=Microbacterium sp. ZW T5_45 TaxID=3378080 RepID=UPI0038552FD1
MPTWSNVVRTVESVVNPFYPLFASVLSWTLAVVAALVAVTVLVWLGVAVTLGVIESRSAKQNEEDPPAPEDPLSVFD